MGCKRDGVSPLADSSFCASAPCSSPSSVPSFQPSHHSHQLSVPSHQLSHRPSISSHQLCCSPPASSHTLSYYPAVPSPELSNRPSVTPMASTTSSPPSSASAAAPYSKKLKLGKADDFSVYRVLLNAPPYHHKDNFFNIIMPRLKVRACYSILCHKYSALAAHRFMKFHRFSRCHSKQDIPALPLLHIQKSNTCHQL